MTRVLLGALLALFVVGRDAAEAGRAATRAACVAACDAATGGCIAAAGATVTKKVERRCRRRTLRRCMRTGLSACPLPAPLDPCPSVPNLVGTWASADVACSQTCVVSTGEPGPPTFEQRPCDAAVPSPFRFVVRAQGPGAVVGSAECNVFTTSAPFVSVGYLSIGASPVEFLVTSLTSPAPLRTTVHGSIEGDTLTGVVMTSGTTGVPPGTCSRSVTVGPMTRVATE